MAVAASETPEVEVPEKPRRRRFTADYKLAILREADGCTEAGDMGALLRREGLYSSHVTTWRQQRERGVLVALGPKQRGRKPKRTETQAQELTKVRRQKAALERKLKQAELVIAIQKKVSAMLEIPLTTPDDDERDS